MTTGLCYKEMLRHTKSRFFYLPVNVFYIIKTVIHLLNRAFGNMNIFIKICDSITKIVLF